MKTFHRTLIIIWLVVFVLITITACNPETQYYEFIVAVVFFLTIFSACIINGIITGFHMDKEKISFIPIPLIIHIISISVIVLLTGFYMFQVAESDFEIIRDVFGFELLAGAYLLQTSIVMIISTYATYFIRKYLFKS